MLLWNESSWGDDEEGEGSEEIEGLFSTCSNLSLRLCKSLFNWELLFTSFY